MYSAMLTEGDILDRLSILEVKRRNGHKVDLLPFDRYIRANHKYETYEAYVKLVEVNEKLWSLENTIRTCHNNSQWDCVTACSRAIIKLNAERAAIKKGIDGEISEVKVYVDLRTDTKFETYCPDGGPID